MICKLAVLWMIRGSLLVATLFVVLPSTACGEQRSNAEIQGQWLYDGHCAECHENTHPDLHKQPPNLHGLFLRKTLPSGAPATDAQVRKTILEGRGTMPAFDRRLREEDVKDLIQYLRKLK
ncbi:MAG: cytochrome c [Terriglobales bacterium]